MNEAQSPVRSRRLVLSRTNDIGSGPPPSTSSPSPSTNPSVRLPAASVALLKKDGVAISRSLPAESEAPSRSQLSAYHTVTEVESVHTATVRAGGRRWVQKQQQKRCSVAITLQPHAYAASRTEFAHTTQTSQLALAWTVPGTRGQRAGSDCVRPVVTRPGR